MTLTKCKKCEQHGTPITPEQFNYKHCNEDIVVCQAKAGTLVCEFCGWKVTE